MGWGKGQELKEKPWCGYTHVVGGTRAEDHQLSTMTTSPFVKESQALPAFMAKSIQRTTSSTQPPTLGLYTSPRRCTLQMGLASSLVIWGHSRGEDPGTVSSHLLSRLARLHQNRLQQWRCGPGEEASLQKPQNSWERLGPSPGWGGVTTPYPTHCEYKEVFTLRHRPGFCTPLRGRVSLNFVP